MYERFFGFREKPFSLLPDATFLYFGRQHSTAYAMLEYGVLNQAGFTVVTGEVGCGKTTLIRHLLAQLDAEVTVGLLSNTHRRLEDLLQWVSMAFDLDYHLKSAVQLYDAFVAFLISEYARRRRVVLIVDEAQNLDAAALEELRTLSNINADKDLVLQLVLVGQPELKMTLERPDLKQLAQRVVAHYHLLPLSQAETSAYIGHRLERAGGSSRLFTPEACSEVYRYSGGVPRLINLLCDTALTYGYADNAEQIGAELVQGVVEENAAGMNLGRRDDKPAAPQPEVSPAAETVDESSADKVAKKPASLVDFDRSDARQLFSHLVR